MSEKLSKSMLDALQSTEWGMTHFSGIVTNRQLPLAVMRRCVAAGLCRSIGKHPMADDDGFTIFPERYRETYVLTEAGRKALDQFYASIGSESDRKTLAELEIT